MTQRLLWNPLEPSYVPQRFIRMLSEIGEQERRARLTFSLTSRR